jgi:hypothetical protein
MFKVVSMKFSDFLIIYKYDLLNSDDDALKKILDLWVKANTKPEQYFELHPEYLEIFEISMTGLKRPEKFNGRSEVEKFVSICDGLYEYHVKILQNQLKLQSRKEPVMNHALDAVECASRSGVKAKIYWATGPHEREALSEVEMSGLGTDADKKIQLSKQISDNFSKLGFDSESRTYLNAHLKDNHHYHAEELLFVKNYENLINFLKQRKWGLEPLEQFMCDEFDFQWMHHLETYPRLEFNISTSPCEHCRHLFLNFRNHLNKLAIHIPVIINFTYPCLTKEINGSQIIIVPFKGDLISTDVYLATRYDNHQERQVPDLIRAQDAITTFDLDISAYDAMEAMFEKPENVSKILEGLKNSVSIKTPASELSWLKSFLDSIPQSLRQKNNNSLIAELQFHVTQLFKKCKNNTVAENQFSLRNDLEKKIATWTGRKKLRHSEFGLFSQHLQDYLKPETESYSFKLTIIMVLISVFFMMQKVMPTLLNSERLGKK